MKTVAAVCMGAAGGKVAVARSRQVEAEAMTVLGPISRDETGRGRRCAEPRPTFGRCESVLDQRTRHIPAVQPSVARDYERPRRRPLLHPRHSDVSAAMSVNWLWGRNVRSSSASRAENEVDGLEGGRGFGTRNEGIEERRWRESAFRLDLRRETW